MIPVAADLGITASASTSASASIVIVVIATDVIQQQHRTHQMQMMTMRFENFEKFIDTVLHHGTATLLMLSERVVHDGVSDGGDRHIIVANE